MVMIGRKSSCFWLLCLVAECTQEYDFGMSYVAYFEEDRSTFSLDVVQDEISGLVWFHDSDSSNAENGQNILYAISDDLQINKGWIKYSYNSSNNQVTGIGGTVLGITGWGDYPTNMDTEGIALLGLPFDNGFYDDFTDNTPTNELNNGLYGYLVISSEGHRRFNTYDHIMLYDMNGTYIKDFTYPQLFNITDNSGNVNNGGFESLSISFDYQCITYANERVLTQDGCTTCHRIVVGSINTETATSASDVDITTEYMLRYDAMNEDRWIVDVIFLNASRFKGRHAPTMPALVLEADRVDYPALYDIFLVDLALGDNDDISDCWSIENNCSDSQAIEKYNVFNFSRELPYDVDQTVRTLNFETMALFHDATNSDPCYDTLILVNDNYNGVSYLSNYWITFEISYCKHNYGNSNSDSHSSSHSGSDSSDSGDSSGDSSDSSRDSSSDGSSDSSRESSSDSSNDKKSGDSSEYQKVQKTIEGLPDPNHNHGKKGKHL